MRHHQRDKVAEVGGGSGGLFVCLLLEKARAVFAAAVAVAFAVVFAFRV